MTVLDYIELAKKKLRKIQLDLQTELHSAQKLHKNKKKRFVKKRKSGEF